MKYLKTPQDVMSSIGNEPKDGNAAQWRGRKVSIKLLIKKLKSEQSKAQKIVDAFEKSIKRETERLEETDRQIKALGNSANKRPPPWMPMP